MNGVSGRLQDKTALITGGGTGIGAATARRFAAEGAQVLICGRRTEPLEETARQITREGGNARCLSMDAGDEQQFASAVADCEKTWGRLDVLVNNAFSYAGGMIGQTSTEDWRNCFRTSLDAAFFGMRAALPGMIERGGGSIVNLSSVVALASIPGAAAYGAAKAALISLGRTAALEGAAAGVRVNTVVPGVVMTPSTRATLSSEAAERATAAAVPLRRIAEAREIADVILFLASDESSYVTGATIVADGGKTCELNAGASDVDELNVE